MYRKSHSYTWIIAIAIYISQLVSQLYRLAGLYPRGILQVLNLITPNFEKSTFSLKIQQLLKGPLFKQLKGPLFHLKVHFYQQKEPTQMKVWLPSWVSYSVWLRIYTLSSQLHNNTLTLSKLLTNICFCKSIVDAHFIRAVGTTMFQRRHIIHVSIACTVVITIKSLFHCQ